MALPSAAGPGSRVVGVASSVPAPPSRVTGDEGQEACSPVPARVARGTTARRGAALAPGRPRPEGLRGQIRVYTHTDMEPDAPSSDLDLSPTRDCHCLGARREARELTRRYEEKLRPHGLRVTQFSILAALGQMGPTPITDLAGVLGLERTTLTRSADVMEENGWIEDAPSDDGRKRPLRLTGEGRAKVEAAFPAWREVQEQVSRERDGPTGTAGGTDRPG